MDSNSLQETLQLLKAFATPMRLAICGYLAARPGQSIQVEELAQIPGVIREGFEKDIRQLSDAGLVTVTEWVNWVNSGERLPAALSINPAYQQIISAQIAGLQRINKTLAPVTTKPIQDEREKTLSHFFKDGRLLEMPVQLKRQQYILEVIAASFEPDKRYTEREVDALLKAIYPKDHCTLRRNLIDFKLLQRENGIYWKI
jgi:hypothetical protein